MALEIHPCSQLVHSCSVKKAKNCFTTPNDPPIYDWSGAPSVPYGIARRIIHEYRKASNIPYCRILFTDAGRQGDPWGGLKLELSGNIYHFHAGMDRFPELIDSGRVLSDEGNYVMARGLPGKMSFNSADWRWVHNELDISTLLSEKYIEKLENTYKGFLTGKNPIPIFQSRIWAKHYGTPIRDDSANCTVVHAHILSQYITSNLTEHMPLDLFNKLSNLVSDKNDDRRTALDCILNQMLSINEDHLMNMFQIILPEFSGWRQLLKYNNPLPSSLLVF